MSNENQQNNEKYRLMTTQPVERLICKFAVPTIISMLITAAYNLADTFFIGKISTQTTGAVGIVFSFMTVLQAIGFYFGHGSGNYISRALGAKKYDDAEKMASTGFFASVFVGVIITALGLIFMNPVLQLLGSTDTILPYAKSYFTYILLAAPFILGSFVLNNHLRFEGNAVYGMLGILSGAALNIILDPILIFVCDLGIAGAAIATGFSQMVGFFILLVICNRKGLKIKIRNCRFNKESIAEINAGGLPSLFRQGLSSVSNICLNFAAGAYGDSAIAAFSVVGRISFIAFAVIIGFGQGFQPVCGFNYGAKKYDRVKKSYSFCVKVSTAVLCVFAVLGFIFSGELVRLFRADDALLVEIGSLALRLQCIAMPLAGFITMSNMYLQNIRSTLRATVLAAARQGLVFIPVMFILSGIFGLVGLQCAQLVSDAITFILAVPLTLPVLRKMTSGENN